MADEVSNGTTIPHSANNTAVNNMFLQYTTGSNHGAGPGQDISLFNWTLVAGTGLNNVLFANNTIVKGGIATGSNLSSPSITNSNSIIQNNIVYRNDGGITANLVPETPSNVLQGIKLANNMWYPGPLPTYDTGTTEDRKSIAFPKRKNGGGTVDDWLFRASIRFPRDRQGRGD